MESHDVTNSVCDTVDKYPRLWTRAARELSRDLAWGLGVDLSDLISSESLNLRDPFSFR